MKDKDLNQFKKGIKNGGLYIEGGGPYSAEDLRQEALEIIADERHAARGQIESSNKFLDMINNPSDDLAKRYPDGPVHKDKMISAQNRIISDSEKEIEKLDNQEREIKAL